MTKHIVFILVFCLCGMSSAHATYSQRRKEYIESMQRANAASAISGASDTFRIKRMVRNGEITPYQGEMLLLEQKKARMDESQSRLHPLTSFRSGAGINCTTNHIGDTAYTNCD